LLCIPISPINIGDTILIKIDYTYNYPYNKGFLHRNSFDVYPDDLKHEIDIPCAGTLSEPLDARY
jgi:hypothetical protein